MTIEDMDIVGVIITDLGGVRRKAQCFEPLT
jgi:hypothetical protein